VTAWFSPDQAELPHTTRQILREAALLPAAAAIEPLQQAQIALQALFRTATPVAVIPGAYGMIREIALRALVEQRVLVLVAGPESAALAHAAEALGREVIRLMVHPGTVPEPAQLLRFLGGPDVDSVALVHAELTLGTQLDLESLAGVVHSRPDILLLVDGIGSLGAAPLETDRWGLDVVISPSAGPLSLPPGLGLASLSPRGAARARTLTGRGRELDLATLQAAAGEGMVGEVAPALALALRHQLDQLMAEGVEVRWGRHAMLRALVEQWAMVRNDLHPSAPAGRRAAASTCLRLPPGSSAAGVISGLIEDDWPVAPGVDLTANGRLCIGHMGEVTAPEVLQLLEAVGRQLDLGR
jgi:aspartate aminotransferase-like enzyme